MRVRIVLPLVAPKSAPAEAERLGAFLQLQWPCLIGYRGRDGGLPGALAVLREAVQAAVLHWAEHSLQGAEELGLL